MTRQEAQRIQYRHSSYYVVYLIAPDGKKTRLGSSQRKTGTGLIAMLRKPHVQAIVAALPGAAETTFRKTATELSFSNGYRIAFGGTLLQEAVDAEATKDETTKTNA